MLACSYHEWRREGIEPIIIGMSDENHTFSSDLTTAGYEIHLLPSSRSLQGLGALSRRLAALRPDVVHIHAEQAFLQVSAIATVSPATGVVRSVHSNFNLAGWARIKRFLRVKATKAMGVAWVSVSGEVADNERRRYENKTHVIENWVDLAAISQARDSSTLRAHLGICSSDFVVTVVGECRRLKNHSLLFRALSSIAQPLHVLHVGNRSKAPVEERDEWSRVPRRHRIHHLGVRDDVPDLLAITNVLVQPSIIEGFSLSVAEALCAGKAVLVNDAPGLRWTNDFQQASITSGEPRRWAQRLNALMLASRESYPVGRGKLDAIASRERFSPARGVAQYADLYRRVKAPLRRDGALVR
jgi:glycosyltransferase involved in cell wall biosynthesis